MISSDLYDKLKIVAIAMGTIAGFLVGAGEMLGNPYLRTAGGLVSLAAAALLEFLRQSSKQYFEDKDIVQKTE